MHDSTRLKKMTLTVNSVKHKLNERFSYHGGLFCDKNGALDGKKIRQVYMMAGLLSPPTDNAEDLFKSIQENIIFLNEYLKHLSGFIR
jgi:hypothetical protein